MIIDIDVRHTAYGFNFVWSKNKAFEIQKDLGISFSHVVDIFIDQHAVNVPYNDIPGSNHARTGYCHSDQELYVAFCYRDVDGPIRLITARKARIFDKKLYLSNIQRNFVNSLKLDLLLDKKAKKAKKAKKKHQNSLAVKQGKQDE